VKNLRLLGLTNFYPPDARGGYGEICVDVMAGLAARGHDVTMLVHSGASGRGVAVRAELDYVLGAWRRPLAGRRAARGHRLRGPPGSAARAVANCGNEGRRERRCPGLGVV
jgi:hypothetical protein